MASIIIAFAPVVVGAVALIPGGRRATVPQLSYAGRIVYSGGLLLAGLLGMFLILASPNDLYALDQTWVSLAVVVWSEMKGGFYARMFGAWRRGGEYGAPRR